jgi:polyhydroxyalkanoate synthase
MLNGIYQSLLSETSKTQKRLTNIIAINTKSITPKVALTPYEVIGKFGRCRLLYFSPEKNEGHPPLFVVPSIINKYYILDLMKGASFIEHLKYSNVPVYLIDWGEPRVQDRSATIEDHIMHWMDWAVKESCRHASVKKIDLFGQCIGGTFAAIYTSLRPDNVKSIVALTAPINFHDEGLLSTWANKSSLDLEKIGSLWGNVYKEFLKESFHMMKPLDRVRKYNAFLKHAWNEKFLDRYLAINHWVDDCIAFPGSTYVKYVQDFYQKNLLYKGELKIGDEVVNLKNISCPVLVISSLEDNIVPIESALALLDLVSSKTREAKQISGGHIGIVISSKAKDHLWLPVENWIKQEGRVV